MKKPKLTLATVAILLFSNFLFAGNPSKKDYTNNLAENMIKHLCKEIQLTDSQKLVLETNAKEYEVKMKNASKEKDKKNEMNLKKEGLREYRTALNNLLTQEQKDSIESKRIERFNKISNNK